MKATKIKMKPGCSNSTKTTEIDQIYIEGCTNIDKIVPMIYKYSIEGKEEGSGGYEKKECY